MHLIIGGAFQGKRDFAVSAYNLKASDIYTCASEEIDFSFRCIDALEEFTFACAGTGKDPVAFFQERKELWRDSVLICQDISCGVVPLGADMRRWRQDTGRLCQYLSREADRVSRIFCGLEQKLK